MIRIVGHKTPRRTQLIGVFPLNRYTWDWVRLDRASYREPHSWRVTNAYVMMWLCLRAPFFAFFPANVISPSSMASLSTPALENRSSSKPRCINELSINILIVTAKHILRFALSPPSTWCFALCVRGRGKHTAVCMLSVFHVVLPVDVESKYYHEEPSSKYLPVVRAERS